MTTLSGLLSGIDDGWNVQDCMLGKEFKLIQLSAHTVYVSTQYYSTFATADTYPPTAYIPPSGKQFIGLILKRLQRASGSGGTIIGFSDAAAAYLGQSAAPTGWQPMFEFPLAADDTILKQQVIIPMSSVEGKYLSVYQAHSGSGIIQLSLFGIEIDI